MKERPSRFFRRSPLGWWSIATALSIWLLGAPTTALAQPWSGGSTLGVQIRGAQGPVEGAVVEIRYRRPGLTAGPEAKRTDSSGQANFLGIAEGRWSLEIRHPDYLAFVASVNVGRGKKTDVVTQFLEASGAGRKTFKVKFLRSDRSIGAVIPGTASQIAAPTPPAPLPRTAPTPPAPSPRTAPTPRADPSPGGRPDPTPARAEAAPPELAPSAPVPEVMLAEPDPIEPEEPIDPIPVRAPQPTPSPEATAEPGPAAIPVPDAVEDTPSTAPGVEVPRLQPGESGEQVLENVPDALTAYRDRTCFDCKPGEWAVGAQIEVPAGEPCRSTGEVAVRRAMRDVAAAISAQLAGFAGPLPTDLAAPPLSLVSAAARNTLAPYLDPTASCGFLAIVVPAGGRFTGFRQEATDAQATGACTGDQECEIGQARFVFSPSIARGPGAAIVYSLFQNTGAEHRTARMTGFFLPPPGWTPN